MAILQKTDFPIDPTSTSGSELADRLNRLMEMIVSTNANASRPSYLLPGGLYTRKDNNGDYVLCMHDSSGDWMICRSTPGASGTFYTYGGNTFTSASSRTPKHPQIGDLWYQTDTETLHVYKQSGFAEIVITNSGLGSGSAGAGGGVGSVIFRMCAANNLSQVAKNEIIAHGQLLNRSNYPELFEVVNKGGGYVSESTRSKPGYHSFFSTGNGSSTFRLPDLCNGVFFRTLDLAGHYDDDRSSRYGGNAPGSFQGDAIQKITGTLGHCISDPFRWIGGVFTRNKFFTQHRILTAIGSPSEPQVVIDSEAGGVRSSTETRPSNVSMLPTIVYK